MHKGLVLSAAIILAAIAPAAAAAPQAMPRNIDVVAMPSPAPVGGMVLVVFFAPDSVVLTPAARRVVEYAVQQAKTGRRVTLVVAEAAGLRPVASAAPVWRARVAVVRQAIVHTPAGQLSDNAREAIRLADR